MRLRHPSKSGRKNNSVDLQTAREQFYDEAVSLKTPRQLPEDAPSNVDSSRHLGTAEVELDPEFFHRNSAWVSMTVQNRLPQHCAFLIQKCASSSRPAATALFSLTKSPHRRLRLSWLLALNRSSTCTSLFSPLLSGSVSPSAALHFPESLF